VLAALRPISRSEDPHGRTQPIGIVVLSGFEPERMEAKALALGADRERHALELHDNIVQELVAIHWALEAGDVEQARAATSATLAQAQQMIGGLLADELAFVPGSLQRAVATAPLEAAGAGRHGERHR
jgi:hypothetical protein